MWLVNSAGSTGRVSGQRRYTVGRLTPARRAISANVTRSTPKSTTQLAAAPSIRSCTGALLIDSMCNTVTHVCQLATPDEVECLGRARRSQTAFGGNPLVAGPGAGRDRVTRGRTRSRSGAAAPVGVDDSRPRGTGRHRRAGPLLRRRSGPTAARGRQVHSGSVAAQGLRSSG